MVCANSQQTAAAAVVVVVVVGEVCCSFGEKKGVCGAAARSLEDWPVMMVIVNRSADDENQQWDWKKVMMMSE